MEQNSGGTGKSIPSATIQLQSGAKDAFAAEYIPIQPELLATPASLCSFCAGRDKTGSEILVVWQK